MLGVPDPAFFLSPPSQRLKGNPMVDKVVSLFTNRYLLAVIGLLFVLGIARRFVGR